MRRQLYELATEEIEAANDNGNGHAVRTARDPGAMSKEELNQLGHQQQAPLKTMRAKCMDCCGGAAKEVRLCGAYDCALWPFRMGKNPFLKKEAA